MSKVTRIKEILKSIPTPDLVQRPPKITKPRNKHKKKITTDNFYNLLSDFLEEKHPLKPQYTKTQRKLPDLTTKSPKKLPTKQKEKANGAFLYLDCSNQDTKYSFLNQNGVIQKTAWRLLAGVLLAVSAPLDCRRQAFA